MNRTPREQHQTYVQLKSLLRGFAEVRQSQEREEARRLTHIRVSVPTILPAKPVRMLSVGFRVCAR